MENRAATRRDRSEVDGEDDVGSDRISQLPESVLYHILCFMSHKTAVQTSVLSRSWRHLGPTRPVIDLRGTCCDHKYTRVRGIKSVCENCFKNDNEAFLSVVDNTFQRYHHHNLCPQELRLEMLSTGLKSISLLEKWIPIIFMKPNACVKAFHISFGLYIYLGQPLPLVVFKVESLRELYLECCVVKGIDSIDNDVVLNNLQTLSLSRVHIADEALEKIMSGCPLVKRLVLSDCEGFKTINIGNKNHCLNYFEISCYRNPNGTSIAIDSPTLESIRIEGRSNWYPNNTNCFPHLKSLLLSHVTLSTHSFHYFSCNFPRLQEITLLGCCGFDEINLSSCSIKRLIICGLRSSFKKIAIEVPNILYFKLSSCYLPKTFSLATTSREWKSHLTFGSCLDGYENNVLPGILKLYGLMKSVSQSQISLTLSETSNCKINQIEWDFNDHPIVVEHLDLYIRNHFPDSLSHFLNALLCIFRPRYTNAVPNYRNDNEELTKCLWNTLIHERKNTEYGWEQHLEEVSIEASDEEGKVWHLTQWTCMPEWSENQQIRFRLKWRD